MKNAPREEVIRLVQQGWELGERLNSLRGQKAEHESALTKLDVQHWEIAQRIEDITQALYHATNELRSVMEERTGRNGELHNLAKDIKEAAKQLQRLKRTIQNSVGRDVCPVCGSVNICEITYGVMVREPDADLFEPDYVNGGCCVNFDETVCCLDCGKHFLGNFEKWTRAK